MSFSLTAPSATQKQRPAARPQLSLAKLEQEKHEGNVDRFHPNCASTLDNSVASFHVLKHAAPDQKKKKVSAKDIRLL